MGYKKTCFNCKKAFNRPIDFVTEKRYPCPDCGETMKLMTHKFRPPNKRDSKTWKLIEYLANNGFIFQSIFETPSGGSYIKYPNNLREAKEFIVKYKEQSINWNKKLNPISIANQLTPKEINELLEAYTSVIIDLSKFEYDIEYFYQLVVKLTNCLVKEIRSTQTIVIEKDIESSYLFVHKQELIEAIKEYNKLRITLFNRFLNHLKIEDSESVFREIIKALRQTNKLNKGFFDEWQYWQHGGDIEFKNKKTNEHVNMLMYNRDSIKDWSLLQYLSVHDKYEGIVSIVSHKIERLTKLMDMLVIDGCLTDVQNELRMKLITLKKA